MNPWRGWWPVGLSCAVVLGCNSEDGCQEDPQAQVLDQRRQIEVDGVSIEAEVADDAVERERGWRHRVCAREALLLIPDSRGPLPIWGCGLTDAVDLLFVANNEILEVVRALPPCDEPCTGCPQVGQMLDVEAVVELPADATASLEAVGL